uniref:NADH dehydrogenase [ubiquinone] 1 beta subcomplex subunit 1 n=1 Tax=Mandrillus leucophaeus TaxID=9568 RepID=A0A2K5XC57_MANLE
MMNLLQIVRDHWVHVLAPMGFVIGCYLDRKSDEWLTTFRNKSTLFKRELRPSEKLPGSKDWLNYRMFTF